MMPAIVGGLLLTECRWQIIQTKNIVCRSMWPASITSRNIINWTLTGLSCTQALVIIHQINISPIKQTLTNALMHASTHTHTHMYRHSHQHTHTHTHVHKQKDTNTHHVDTQWALTPHSTMTGLLKTLSHRRQYSFLLGGSTNTWISYDHRQFQQNVIAVQQGW